jgi:hypothetical protein
MTKSIVRIASFAIAAWWLVSCSGTLSDNITPEEGLLYAKFKVGEQRLYQVVKKSYPVGQKVVIDSFQLKETIQAEILNPDGSKTYQTLREIKRKADFQFVPSIQYYQTVSYKELVSSEANIQKILLRFPLNYGAEWNINELNTGDEKKVIILKPSKEVTDLVNTKKDLLMVEIEDFDDNLTAKNKQILVFSKNIGLVYHENTQLEYCYINEETVRPCNPNKKVISSGFEEVRNLIKYTPAP